MPKQWYVLDRFDGGLNNDANPRDIADNELQVADDIVTNDIGKIKLMGTIGTVSGSSVLTHVDDIDRGYGLFRFDGDYALSGQTSKNFFAIAGYEVTSDDFCVAIYDSSFNYYGSLIQLNETQNSGFIPVFYYVDGALRICDGGFNTNSTNYWFGYILRTHFSGLSPGGSADSYAAWYSKVNTLAAPTRGLLRPDLYENGGIVYYGLATGGDADTLTDTGDFSYWTAAQIDSLGYIAYDYQEEVPVTINTRTSDDEVETDSLVTAGGGDDQLWNGDIYFIFPPAGTGFNIGIINDAGSSNIEAGTYQVSSTFIYDGIQESLPYTLSGQITLNAGDELRVTVYCVSPFDPRISGGRIYIKKKNSPNFPHTLLMDIDLERGYRLSLEDSYTSWGSVDSGGAQLHIYSATVLTLEDGFNVETYQLLNGFNPENLDEITAKYKTACVANRMAYVGNVLYDGVKYEDAIFKSFPNRFDIFTLDRRLEIVRGDGESIIKLEEFADRILVFKEVNLYILNVSQEIEFLEAKFDFKGVRYPYQTVRTEYGVVWANEYGVFLYDGERVHDLLLDRSNPMRRKISISSWQSHWDSTGAISYDSNEKRIYLWADITSTSSENVYVYSMVSGGWTRGIGKMANSANKYSNFANDWNGNMITYDATGNNLEQWSNTPAATAFINITTKELLFDNVSKDKRFYGVNITHKNASTGGSAIEVRYGRNSGALTNAMSVESLTAGTTYHTDEMRVATSNVTNSKSIALKLYDTPGSNNFELDDISFLWRGKGNR